MFKKIAFQNVVARPFCDKIITIRGLLLSQISLGGQLYNKNFSGSPQMLQEETICGQDLLIVFAPMSTDLRKLCLQKNRML